MQLETMELTELETQSIKTAGRESLRWLSLGAVAGPVLYHLAWFILGLLRSGYEPLRQTISVLGVGPLGGGMDTASVIAGLLLIVGVVAVFQGFKQEVGTVEGRICIFFLLVLPVGILLSGFFTMDTPFHTPGAAVALLASVVTFPIVGFLLRRKPGWRYFGTGLILSGPLTFFLLYGFVGTLNPSKMAINTGISGLWQRAVIMELLAWYMALGWFGFRRLR
jgi:hypothetical membrane protein